MSLDELGEILSSEMENIQRILSAEASLQCVTHEQVDVDDNVIGATVEETEIEVAADSGSVANVIHPAQLPRNVEIRQNDKGEHFVGANNSRIEHFGDCTTSLTTEEGAEAECDWSLAEVSRPLHSVSKMCGQIEAPKHDVLFNAARCVVVPAGVVERVLQHISPLLEYKRKGGLYVAKMKVSGFARQGARS